MEIETVTVHERMIVVVNLLGDQESCEFEMLLWEDGQLASRPVIIATFLAILELTRVEALGLYQGLDADGVPQGAIHLRRLGEAGDGLWTERISDLM